MQMSEAETITVDEYFKLERLSEEKHEYLNGEVFAMAGFSVCHNMIVANVIVTMGIALDGTDCQVFPSGIKVELDPGKHYVYPDVSVVCGKVETVEGRNDAITNPKIVFEILSESTKDYDRASKFKAYRKLLSLTDYILIDQYCVSVEHHRKQGPGQWVMREYESLQDILVLEEFGISLPLSQIYRRVDFENG